MRYVHGFPPPHAPVDIICESFGFSVGNACGNTSVGSLAQELAAVFRDSHNRSLEIVLATSLSARHLRRFPRFHKFHHNNKADSVSKKALRNWSVLKIVMMILLWIKKLCRA
jgi:hypothetical protein